MKKALAIIVSVLLVYPSFGFASTQLTPIDSLTLRVVTLESLVASLQEQINALTGTGNTPKMKTVSHPSKVTDDMSIDSVSPDHIDSSTISQGEDTSITISGSNFIKGDSRRKQIPYLSINTPNGLKTVYSDSNSENGTRLHFTIPGYILSGVTGKLDAQLVRDLPSKSVVNVNITIKQTPTNTKQPTLCSRCSSV